MPAVAASTGRSPVHIHARLLPADREADLWVVNGRVTWEPVAGATTVAEGGWVLPALMDSHLHIGIAEMGGPLDDDVLEQNLAELARTGIGAARVLGSPTPLPEEVLAQPGGPMLLTAGVPVAAPDRFIPGWGRLATDTELVDAAVEEARFGWSKIIADWFDDDGGYGPSFPADVLAEAIAAIHAQGHRVAIHTQGAEAGRDAVAASADSIEHGMHLPWEVLPELAAHDGILVPTGQVFEQMAPMMSADEIPATIRDWFAEGLAAHPGLVRRALQEGVTVLAGTDLPVGALIDEIYWLVTAGMPVEDAIGAASWTAREAFDLPRLREGDRADLIRLDHDPRENLEALRNPEIVILDGQIIESELVS